MRTIHILTLWLALSACNDASESPDPDAGHASPKPDASAADSGKVDTACPATLPTIGGACSGPMLCTYKHNGPCPPDPDQLRQCYQGKWMVTAPAIACRDAAAAEDAGSE